MNYLLQPLRNIINSIRIFGTNLRRNLLKELILGIGVLAAVFLMIMAMTFGDGFRNLLKATFLGNIHTETIKITNTMASNFWVSMATDVESAVIRKNITEDHIALIEGIEGVEDVIPLTEATFPVSIRLLIPPFNNFPIPIICTGVPSELAVEYVPEIMTDQAQRTALQVSGAMLSLTPGAPLANLSSLPLLPTMDSVDPGPLEDFNGRFQPKDGIVPILVNRQALHTMNILLLSTGGMTPQINPDRMVEREWNKFQLIMGHSPLDYLFKQENTTSYLHNQRDNNHQAYSLNLDDPVYASSRHQGNGDLASQNRSPLGEHNNGNEYFVLTDYALEEDASLLITQSEEDLQAMEALNLIRDLMQDKEVDLSEPGEQTQTSNSQTEPATVTTEDKPEEEEPPPRIPLWEKYKEDVLQTRVVGICDMDLASMVAIPMEVMLQFKQKFVPSDMGTYETIFIQVEDIEYMETVSYKVKELINLTNAYKNRTFPNRQYLKEYFTYGGFPWTELDSPREEDLTLEEFLQSTPQLGGMLWEFQFDHDYESAKDLAATLRSGISGIETTIMAFGGLLLILAAVSVFYAFMYLIIRREKEIGLYRFYGASKFKVIFLLVLEASIVGFICAMIGYSMAYYLITDILPQYIADIVARFNDYFQAFLTEEDLRTLSFGTFFQFNTYGAIKYVIIGVISSALAAFMPALIGSYTSLFKSINR